MMQRPGFFKQLGWMFGKPAKLFDAVKEKPMILLPIIIAVIGGLFTGLYGANSLNGLNLASIPVKMQETMKAMGPVTIATGALGGAASLFVNAFIFWILFKILKGKGGYMQSVSIVGFASYPFMLREILRYFFADPQTSQLDMTALLAAAKTATFGGCLMAVLGIVGIVFVVWTAVLIIKGFTRVSEIKASKVVLVIVLFFVVSILLQTITQYATMQALLHAPNINMGG
jgi:hypothetical protein